MMSMNDRHEILTQGFKALIMKLIISFLAMVSILLGLISMVTPIPGGTLLIAGGLTALICSSPSARFCIMWIRARINWFNRLIFWLEEKVGTRIKIIGTALNKTRPPEDVATTLSHREFVKLERAKDQG